MPKPQYEKSPVTRGDYDEKIIKLKSEGLTRTAIAIALGCSERGLYTRCNHLTDLGKLVPKGRRVKLENVLGPCDAPVQRGFVHHDAVKPVSGVRAVSKGLSMFERRLRLDNAARGAK